MSRLTSITIVCSGNMRSLEACRRLSAHLWIGAADPLIAACSRQGLYLTTDLFVSRKVAWRDIGEDRDGFVGMNGFKRLVLTHEGAYSNPWEAMHPDECGIGFFSISGNPLVQATERAAFCLFVRGDVTSSDQFVHDKAKRTFTVDTPLTAGGFAESGDIRTKSLAVRCQGGPMTVWASALDGRPLVESGRILLTHLTDIQNTGQTYDDDSRRILKKWGRVPHLFRAGTAQIALSLGDGDFEVWALGSDGMRLRKVPSSFTPAGRLTFVADVAADSSSATWLYEVLRTVP